MGRVDVLTSMNDLVKISQQSTLTQEQREKLDYFAVFIMKALLKNTKLEAEVENDFYFNLKVKEGIATYYKKGDELKLLNIVIFRIYTQKGN